MDEILSSRSSILSTLRDATRGDLWLSQFALFSLCEDVDLGTLIGLVDRVLEAEEDRGQTPEVLKRLLQERWSIT